MRGQVVQFSADPARFDVFPDFFFPGKSTFFQASASRRPSALFFLPGESLLARFEVLIVDHEALIAAHEALIVDHEALIVDHEGLIVDHDRS